MEKIDLHIHSNYSDDGEFTVREILELCGQMQIEYLAITDHNTVKGVQEALVLAQKMGIQVIAGVELDCVHNGRNFHLLGYHFDYTRPIFAEIEQSIFEQEQNVAEQKIELIQKETQIPICAKEVFTIAGDRVVTGELIAEVLLRKEDAKEYKALMPYLLGGNRSDNPYVNFYWDYFSQGKPAYVEIKYISMIESIELIHATGGIAILAHPKQNLQSDYVFLDQLIKIGIDGIEAYSSYHSRMEAKYFNAIAQKNKLIVTCGSDFHGKIKPAIPLCGHRANENMPKIIAELKKVGIL